MLGFVSPTHTLLLSDKIPGKESSPFCVLSLQMKNPSSLHQSFHFPLFHWTWNKWSSEWLRKSKWVDSSCKLPIEEPGIAFRGVNKFSSAYTGIKRNRSKKPWNIYELWRIWPGGKDPWSGCRTWSRAARDAQKGCIRPGAVVVFLIYSPCCWRILLSREKYSSIPLWIAGRWQIAAALHSIWSEAAHTLLSVLLTPALSFHHNLPLLLPPQELTFQMMPFLASLAGSPPGSYNVLGVNCLLKDRSSSAQSDCRLPWEYSCLLVWSRSNAVQMENPLTTCLHV